MDEPLPDEIADAAWDEAHRRASAIRQFLRDRPNSQSVSDVLDLAWELGVSKATAYRLLKAFRTAGTVVSLVDRKRGRPKGHSMMRRDNQDENRATIRMRMCRRGGDEGRA